MKEGRKVVITFYLEGYSKDSPSEMEQSILTSLSHVSYDDVDPSGMEVHVSKTFEEE